MRVSKEYKETTNRNVYNKARKEYLNRTGKIRCSWCSYHSGDNNTDKCYGKWTDGIDYAKAGLIRQPNWKMISKLPKQWMVKKSLKIHTAGKYFSEFLVNGKTIYG
mgnify:CR=1 FL=1